MIYDEYINFQFIKTVFENSVKIKNRPYLGTVRNYPLSAATTTAAAITATTAVISAAATADDKDKNDYETTVVSAKKIITHI